MNSPHVIHEIREKMRDRRASVRADALGQIADKKRGGIELKIDDPEVIPILIDALSDRDRGVQRAAALALRPFVTRNPDLLGTVLPHYAASTFDGSFSHVGLLDVRDGRIWVPRFAAVKGHAALLADGNTDRYFKFEFFLPNQAPRRLRTRDNTGCAHLLIHFILDWSYSGQKLIPEEDERRMTANKREHQGYASAVAAFYDSCRLPCDIAVHHLLIQAKRRNIYEIDVKTQHYQETAPGLVEPGQ